MEVNELFLSYKRLKLKFRVFWQVILGDFEYEYEIDYDNDFSILVCRLHIIM